MFFFLNHIVPRLMFKNTLARRLIFKNQTLRRHLASTDRDDGLSDWTTPLFPKLERFSKHSVRSVFRRSRNDKCLPLRRIGSRMTRFFAISHAGNKFRNARKAKLIAASFPVNARDSARRVGMLRLSLQPRGCEKSRLLDEIHERVDLQHEISCSTIFHDEWVSLSDFLGCCEMYFSHRACQKTQNHSFAIKEEHCRRTSASRSSWHRTLQWRTAAQDMTFVPRI